jgi:pimeloyl-ACP methyl ester carboxylesterase
MNDAAARTVGRVAASGIELAWPRLVRRRVAGDRSAVIATTIETFRLIGSHGFAFDEQYIRDLAGRSLDRGYDPAGARRQLAASVAQPNRTADLRRITVPTLVIHGLHDPLVAPSGGLAIARAIPDSRFVGFSGMGHDLPRALWPEFVREIVALAGPGRQGRSADLDRSGPANNEYPERT